MYTNAQRKKMMKTPPLERAKISLTGLTIGDCFGQQFFVYGPEKLIENRKLPPTEWYYTDDTLMALSIYEILRKFGEINQNELARSFGQHYKPNRGYGPAMHRSLERFRGGEPWREVSHGVFHGQGSFGNGSAMRIAPLGAYFADDLEKTVHQAKLSAEVTHAHPEGIAGGIAAAVAAALAWQLREKGETLPPRDFIEQVLPHVPESDTRDGLHKALSLPSEVSVHLLVSALGNGSMISCQDTVPFTLWCAGKWLHNYEEALWFTLDGLGDRDTTCAIVGGIVAGYTGEEAIPKEWRKRREELPTWPFEG